MNIRNSFRNSEDHGEISIPDRETRTWKSVGGGNWGGLFLLSYYF